jgi:transcriptional regulator with XRE-family HTH domain
MRNVSPRVFRHRIGVTPNNVVKYAIRRSFHALSVIQWVKVIGVIRVNQEQAEELGKLLRERRQELGLSTHQLSARVGVRQSTISRIEHGRFASPRPAKLARIAEALGLRLADVYARAGYLVPDELPSLEPYLSTKYRHLSEAAVAELVGHFDELTARHCVSQQPLADEGSATQ